MAVAESGSDLTFLGAPVVTWRGEGRVERVIVFLHGSGDCGRGVSDWLDSLAFSSGLDTNTAVIFPSARPRPYTMYGGEVSSVWHDRRELNISAWEDREGIETMTTCLDSFISEICQAWNLTRENVVMGGFSQGGHMTLQAVYGEQRLQVAATFALSSFLCSHSQVYQALRGQEDRERPALFLSCGSEDSLVCPAWVEDTRDRLTQLGVRLTHSTVPGLQHELESKHLNTLIQWINCRF